jgi:hypothetical protein
MKLSVGDKVRVHFYPPNTSESFVEGIVERTEVKTFDGPGFAFQVTREVIMGREAQTHRNLPYITRYEKEDSFEGRIVVLEAAGEVQQDNEQVPVMIEVEAVTEVEPTSEADDTHETEVVPAAEPDVAVELEIEPIAEAEGQKRGWMKFFRRAA